jgi:probable F420-dependent oxidoreductase
VSLRFIFDYPVINGAEIDMLDAGPIDEVAARAERYGFDGFALTDHPVPGVRWLNAGGHQALDPFVALGFAAAATSSLRLLTHLAVAPYRNPFILAKAAATVDKLSGGRMILGLGTGYHKTEFFALGIDWDQRNALFDEALEVLPLHWAGEPFSYNGINFDAREVIGLPRPVQNPIPIWIGGNSKLSRRRIAERAQGWMPLLGSPELHRTTRTPEIGTLEDLSVQVAQIREAAADAGRTDHIDLLYSYEDRSLADDPTADVDRHREAFAELERAGVDHVSVSSPTHTTAETLAFIEAFGSTYLR